MNEPEVISFKPRWMRERTEANQILDDTPPLGTPSEVLPRINTRLLPIGGIHRISAKTLSETISTTQAIVQYAGGDVYHGLNPDFADLRSLSNELLSFTRLTIEPFEEGSFVIPARLEASPITVKDSEEPRQVTAEEVVKRFDEILVSLRDQPRGQGSPVSIGAIQAVESLGKAIRREVEVIEFSSFDSTGRPRSVLHLDHGFIERVQRIREARRSTQTQLETLEGIVTALDIEEGKLHLSIAGQKQRVIGHFTKLFLQSLLESLGRPVQLSGHVVWKRGKPATMQVLSAKLLSDEQ